MKASTLKKTMALVGLLSTMTLAACSANSNSSTANSTATASSSYFTDSDFDSSYDTTTAATIELSGSSATVSGSGVSVSGSTVTISSEGTYIISGSSENVQILVKAADSAKVQLVLDNVTMTGDQAAIYVEEADKVTLTLAEGSTNSISDSAANSNATVDAAIYSKSDLTFNGEGQLTVKGNYNNAIESNDDLRITGGTYIVSAVGHGFNVNDALNIANATIDVTATEDALHSDNDEESNMGNLYLQDATITASAGDDGFHASGALVVDGGSYTVSQSTEALEGTTVHILSGSLDLTATEDGINAADASSYSEASLTIDGGDISLTAGGDGLDSNGNIAIKGGSITVSGAKSDGDGAIDYEGEATITGGEVFVVGSSGMTQGFSSSSTQASILATAISGEAGATITVKDASGQTLASYTATQSFDSVLVSSSAIKEGESYTVEVNGQSITATARLETGAMNQTSQ